MMKKWIPCRRVAISLCWLLVGFGAPLAAAERIEVSPYLDQVTSLLKPIEAVEKAPTPQEKQAAILNHFRKRHVSFPRVIKKSLHQNDLETANNALEHKFIGQPDYPPQFRGKDGIDWDSNPFKDYEWIWQFHRFYWLLPLSRIYRETGDSRYAAEWAFEINSWIDHMHDVKLYTTHAGWRTLDAAIRLRIWTETLDTFVHSPACDGATLVNLLWSIHYHLEYIASLFPENKVPKAHNWSVFQIEGLFSAAAFPEFKKSEKFIRTASRVAVKLAETTILPDGVINEYIPSYHMAYPRQYLSFWETAKSCGNPTLFPDSYRKQIENAIQAVMLWSHPDGTSPVFGDSWQHAPGANRRWMKRFLDDFPGRADFRWFATGGKKGKMPETLNYSLPVAGYHVLRSGWGKNDLFLILKNTCPTTKMWHNQDDNMTFELSAFGRHLMTDSGCYIYHGDPEWRAWFRSPVAHQLISIDNQPINGGNAKFLARGSSELAESFVVENEPHPGLIHRRTVILLDKRCYLLLDVIRGEKAGKLRQHFQFNPGDWERNGGAVFSTRPDDVNLFLLSAAKPEITLEEEEGWISPRYLKKEKRPAFAFIQNKAKDQTVAYLTALIPVKKGGKMPQSTLSFADDSMREIVFSLDGKTYEITIDAATLLPECREQSERVN